MNMGVIAGALGGVFGLLGGATGTYFSIKNTNGPRARAFMVKSAVVCWGFILLFVGLLLFLPRPYSFLLWIPYAVLLPIGILYGNRTQQRIRREESDHA